MKFRIGLKEGEQYSLPRFWKNVALYINCRAGQLYLRLLFILFIFTFNFCLNSQWYPPKNRAFWWLRIKFMLILDLFEISFNIPLPMWRKLKKVQK